MRDFVSSLLAAFALTILGLWALKIDGCEIYVHRNEIYVSLGQAGLAALGLSFVLFLAVPVFLSRKVSRRWVSDCEVVALLAGVLTWALLELLRPAYSWSAVALTIPAALLVLGAELLLLNPLCLAPAYIIPDSPAPTRLRSSGLSIQSLRR